MKQSNRPSQEFYSDSNTKTFYYVNHIERGVLVIEKGNLELHHFFMNIYCKPWEYRNTNIDTYRFVDSIADIYFDEEGNALKPEK